MKFGKGFQAVTAALGILAGAAATAQPAYPAKPIKLIVPFAAGGSTDLLARVVANGMSRELGQSVVVENRTGASGNIGMDAVAKAQPDGYTLLFASSNLTANPAQMAVPFDVSRDFAPISRLSFMPLILVKSSRIPARTVAELVSAVRAQPGKFNYSSSGTGGAIFLAGEMFKSQAQLDMAHIPYSGAGPAINDVAAGQVQMTFTTFSSARALLKTDKIAAMAVAGKRRLTALPEVPTFAEAGLNGMEIGVMNGLLAPAKTPRAVIDRLYAAVHSAAQHAAFKTEFVEQGADLLVENPAQFSAFIQADVQWWKQLIARTDAGR